MYVYLYVEDNGTYVWTSVVSVTDNLSRLFCLLRIGTVSFGTSCAKLAAN